MASGVKVTDEVKQAFNDMKLGHKYKWCLFKISEDEKWIVIDQVETDKTKSYQDFCEVLMNQSARYAIVDVDFEHIGSRKEKIALVCWCPENCKVKEKMVHASSKEELRTGLGKSGYKEIQACSADELDYCDVSGINISDEITSLYDDFKLRKKQKFIIYKLADNYEHIVTDHIEPETLDKKCKDNMCEDEAKQRFEEFKQKVLATDEPKFCIVDVNCWKNEPNNKKRPVTKIGLVLWCPDTLPIKKKMVFAASAEALKNKLKSGFKAIQCNDESDLDYDEIAKELSQN